LGESGTYQEAATALGTESAKLARALVTFSEANSKQTSQGDLRKSAKFIGKTIANEFHTTNPNILPPHLREHILDIFASHGWSYIDFVGRYL